MSNIYNIIFSGVSACSWTSQAACVYPDVHTSSDTYHNDSDCEGPGSDGNHSSGIPKRVCLYTGNYNNDIR